MPNYDAGHYFLTVLAPIRPDPVVLDGIARSRRYLMQDVLAEMPTSENTVASQGKGTSAPFARTTCTHFARFVVLDDVVFNGRVSGDSLVARLSGTDPLTPQKVDRLSTPYLIFVADFDAESGEDAVLRGYATELWDSMQAELISVFQHCMRFDAVKTADDFFFYLKACQIETTMPFNDYWSVMPALTDFSFTPYLLIAIAALLVLVVGLLHMHAVPAVLALALLGFLVVIGLNRLFEAGQKPFPKAPAPAPGPDLPTVLKALTLQREFTDFVIAAQGMDDQALYDSFGTLLAATSPQGTGAPTQVPGIIGV